MKDFFDNLVEEVRDFLRSVKGWFSGGVFKSKGIIGHLFRTTAKPEPRKIWCFYEEPYRKGLSATGLLGVSILTIIGIILLVIAIITFIVILFAGIIYMVGGAILLGLGLGGGYIGSMIKGRNGEGIGSGIAGLLGGCYLGYYIMLYIFGFGESVYESGIAFSQNLNLFFYVTNFIGQTWMYIVGIIVFPALTVLMVAGLTILTVYLLRGFEQGVSLAYGIRNPCPVCAEKSEPAIYFCNHCNEKHPISLIPSKYGVFSHRCTNCSEKLPTMLVQGRNKLLPHKCRHCKTDIHKKEAGTDKHIAFVGGQTTGKTCLMLQLTKFLMEKGATIAEGDQEREFNRLIRLMEKGETPPKTNPVNIYRAFQLMLKKGIFPYHLHFYDLAGEKFEDATDAATHRFFTTLDSIVFLLDPYGIKQFCQNNSIPTGLEYKFYDPIDLVRNLIQVLERYNDKAKVRKIDFNLVLVKMDTGYFDMNVVPEGDQEIYRNKLKSFISEELGQASLIHHIEQHFSKVNYHIMSALGRIPAPNNKSPFEPVNLKVVFGKTLNRIKVKV